MFPFAILATLTVILCPVLSPSFFVSTVQRSPNQDAPVFRPRPYRDLPLALAGGRPITTAFSSSSWDIPIELSEIRKYSPLLSLPYLMSTVSLVFSSANALSRTDLLLKYACVELSTNSAKANQVW